MLNYQQEKQLKIQEADLHQNQRKYLQKKKGRDGGKEEFLHMEVIKEE